jgi:hypothetical protein
MRHSDIHIFRNSDVKRIIAFIPKGHRHIRLYIETGDKAYVFQEATIDAIIRAYINVVTHPTNKAVELVLHKIDNRKKGYAEYQHLESRRGDEQIINEMMEVVGD